MQPRPRSQASRPSRTPGAKDPAPPGPPTALRLAETILLRADRDHPADDALRAILRSQHGLNRSTSAYVARLVFTFLRWRGFVAHGLPLSRQILATAEMAKQFADTPDSFSDSFLARAVPSWASEFMDARPGWYRTLQTEPLLWLRARPGTAAAVAERLGDCRQPFLDRAPDALRYDGVRDLFRHEAFQAGAFEIQDIASQLVALVCGPRPGENWWDACAGEGGKTLHLADLMANQGCVWATDRAAWRLRRLRLRAARAGLFNIRWAEWDGGARRPMPGSFDGVLVDAPCSGLGTWQRNPHSRWTTTPDDVAALAGLQLDLLRQAAIAVKPGGRLVYAVCTLTRRETTEVAEGFATANQAFEPVPAPACFRAENGTNALPGSPLEELAGPLWIWPQDWEGNGMFIAAWRRTG